MKYLIHRLKTDPKFRKKALHEVLDHVQFILNCVITVGIVALAIKWLGT